MLRSKFTPRINVIQDQDSKILQSQDETIQQCTKYYSSLYRDHEESDTITRDLKKITPPSTEEPAEHLVRRRRRRGHTHTKTKQELEIRRNHSWNNTSERGTTSTTNSPNMQYGLKRRYHSGRMEQVYPSINT